MMSWEELKTYILILFGISTCLAYIINIFEPTEIFRWVALLGTIIAFSVGGWLMWWV